MQPAVTALPPVLAAVKNAAQLLYSTELARRYAELLGGTRGAASAAAVAAAGKG